MAPYLEVTGSGAATAPPDRLDLHVAVALLRADVGTALSDLADRVRSLGAALRAADVDGADVQTTGSNVYEETDQQGARTGFRATQDLRVRLRDPAAASAVVAAAVDAVGDDFRLGHIAWSIADESELATRAREAAFADAREKAEHLARLAGGSLGELRRSVEGSGHGGTSKLAATRAGGADFAAEPGECRVEVSLTVRWTLDR